MFYIKTAKVPAGITGHSSWWYTQVFWQNGWHPVAQDGDNVSTGGRLSLIKDKLMLIKDNSGVNASYTQCIGVVHALKSIKEAFHPWQFASGIDIIPIMDTEDFSQYVNYWWAAIVKLIKRVFLKRANGFNIFISHFPVDEDSYFAMILLLFFKTMEPIQHQI